MSSVEEAMEAAARASASISKSIAKLSDGEGNASTNVSVIKALGETVKDLSASMVALHDIMMDEEEEGEVDPVSFS